MVIAKFGEVKITFTDLMQPLAGIEGDIRDHEVTHCSLNQSFALVETKGQFRQEKSHKLYLETKNQRSLKLQNSANSTTPKGWVP